MEINKLYYLYKKHKYISIDSRNIIKNSIFFSIKGKKYNGNYFAYKAILNGASYALVDDKKYENIKKNIFYVKNSLLTLQKLSNYHRNIIKLPIIAITGSNGKTTTKELVCRVLSKKFLIHTNKGNFNNHIGVPLTILSTPYNSQIIIVEIGASNKNDIALLCKIIEPDYGYITNFGYAHIQGFKNFNGVISGKTELYKYLELNNKKVFINMNDLIQVKNSKKISKYGFSNNDIIKSDIKIYKNYLDINNFYLKFKEIKIYPKIIGTYNITNISASIAIGYYFKIKIKDIKSAIESYIPKNNRSQIIKKTKIKIILDAYNANLSSMIEAILNINKFDGFKYAILGDMLELGNMEYSSHEKIIKLIEKTNINITILVGKIFSSIPIYNKKIIQFNCMKKLIFFLKKKKKFKQGIILIKGSRKLSLEKIVYLI